MQIMRITTAVVVALALSGGAASAQDRPSDFDNWVIPGWTFTPSIAVAGGWDSNIAMTSPEVLGRPTDSDRLFIIEPYGQFDFHSSRTEFVAGYKGLLRRYVTADELNGFDQRGYLSFRHLATRRLSVFANNQYEDAPTTDELELNGVLFARVGSRTNRMSAGADFRVTKFTDLSVGYENTWVAFDNETAFLRGGVMHAVRADYTARLSERTRLGGEYRIRRSNINDDTRIMWFHDIGGVLEQQLSPHVTLGVAAGYSLLEDPAIERQRGGLYFRSDLTGRTDHFSVGAGYERSYAPSFGFGGANASQELRGFVHMPFMRNRLYANGTGLWRRTNPLLTDELDLDTFTVDTAVGYGLSRWLRLEGFYQFSRQDSHFTLAGVDTTAAIDRHRLGVQVVVSQPMRIR